MKSTLCDKCKKKIDDKQAKDVSIGNEKYELCESCANRISAWFKESSQDSGFFLGIG